MMDFVEVFTDIYERNVWGHGSGGGSTILNTKPYREYIENYIKAYHINTVVDFGCGDWQFSKVMNWSGVKYTGYDCVWDLIEHHNTHYKAENIHFEFIPKLEQFFNVKADLLLVKDVFQHWENEDVTYFLNNIKRNFEHIVITNSESYSAKNEPLNQFNCKVTLRYSCEKSWKEISIINGF